ncbi:MAG TPA: hypothetical protein VI299_12115 [Polyangiales bacterium]
MTRWIVTSMLLAACSGEVRAAAPVRVEPVQAKPADTRIPLGERLSREAASRPVRAVRMEQLADALKGRGVVISRERQVLASVLDASYCETATTSRGLALSLCEFADADAAERGLARSLTTFEPLIPGRALDTRFNALLTVTQATDDEAARERELVRKTFAALSPSER